MPNIVLIGSIGLDSIRTPFGEHEEILGGSAVYAAYSASLFTRTGIVAVVGNDFPEDHMNSLKTREILLEGLAVADGPTFRWKGYYEGDMGEAFTLDTQLGVFAEFQPVVPPEWRDREFVFLGNIHPQLQLDVLDQFNNTRLVSCDTMNLWIENEPDLLKKVIERVDLLYVNDQEAKMITGKDNLHQAAAELNKMGPEYVVIKCGGHGARVYVGDDVYIVPALPLQQFKDTTGAGDTFAGGMMGYIAARGVVDPETLRTGALVGSVMASFTVEDFSIFGLQQASWEDLNTRYDRVRQMVTYAPLA